MNLYEIDGAQFTSLDEALKLLDEILIDAGLVPEDHHVGNLDGLNDALEGWSNPQGTDDVY